GTNWVGGTLSAAAGSDPYIQITSNITNVGPFSIGDSGSTVPVKLLSFNASRNQDNVVLNWKTASEINNHHFDIERSIDRKLFKKISEEKGAGNSTSVINYLFVDKTANEIFAQSNVIYYRLKQVDIDGKFAYSTIASVSDQLSTENAILSVQPNPFKDEFELSYSSSLNAIVNIQVTDVFGKMVYSINSPSTKGLNLFKMPTDIDLKSGVYFIKLTQNDEIKIVKIIKQN
ncbi:MAG: T9SS type A sorting domain-containing protein, partial [Bacteroidota bacterium]